MRARALIPLIIFAAAAASMAGWSPDQLSWLRVAHEPTGTIPFDGLVTYYAFEGTEGPIVDSHGNYDADNEGNATRGVDGKIGNAIQFDGNTQYINAGVLTNFANQFDGGKLSVSFWIKSDSTSQDVVMGSYDSGSGKSLHLWYLYINRNVDHQLDQGKIYVRFRTGGAGPFLAGESPDVGINDNEWHHVVAIADLENGVLDFWVDGENVGVNAYRGEEKDMTVNATGLVDYDLFVGAWNSGGSAANHLQGILDETAFYSRELEEEDIMLLYNEGKGRTYP